MAPSVPCSARWRRSWSAPRERRQFDQPIGTFRDSLSATMYAGTSEIMRNVMARFAGVPTG